MSNKGTSFMMPNAEDHFLAFLANEKKQRIQQQKSDSEIVKDLLGEDTAVIYNGKEVYHLNASLILRKGIDAPELRQLKSLHAEKLKYFDLMKETDESKKLKEYAQEIELIEFAMQKAWNFPEDRNFHEWYKVPKCTCPKLDNADNRGTVMRIVSMNCPVHGQD